MRRLRRTIHVGAAVTLLVLGAAATPTAAQEAPPAIQQGGQSDEQRADQAKERPRAKPVEPKGNPASPAAMRAGRLSCGDVITKSTTLVADIGPCPADGIIIGADNIRLNLNGHTISGTSGPGDGNAAGIRLAFRTGVTITGHPGNSGKTGTVTNFDGGVFINGGSGNTIENLVVRDNIGPGGENPALLGDGIVLFHSANNRILNNVVAHNGPFDGIGVLGVDSNDNLLQGNTVEDTLASEGFFVVDGVGIVINNFLDEVGTPRRGEPIRNNDVIDNVVRRSANSGISNITNIGARVVGNTVQDNGQRPELCFDLGEANGEPPTGEIFCQPTALPSNGIGFSTGPRAPAATEALIEGNTVTGNAGDGISIASLENQIVGNTALGNGRFEDRFDLFESPRLSSPCHDNVYRDNVFETANHPCIYEEQGLTPSNSP